MALMRKLAVFSLCLMLAGCAGKPSVNDAKKFLERAEQRELELGNEAQKASWVQENFITDDTETLSALANQRAGDEGVRLAKEAKTYDGVDLPADMARKMKLLKVGFTLAPPSDPKESAEVNKLAASLDGTYGKGKYCPAPGKPCMDINQITKVMAENTD